MLDPTQPDASTSKAETGGLLSKEIEQLTPKFMEVVTAQNDDVKRDAGVLITRKDIQNIREFVRYANQLPQDLAQVKQILGITDTHIPGLEPSDIKDLYSKIQGSVVFWPGIEKRLKETGAGLIATAGTLRTYGTSLIEQVRHIQDYDATKKTLGDVSDKDLTDLPDIPLSAEGIRQIPSLVALVNDMVDTIHQQKEKAVSVNNIIRIMKQDFRSLESEVALKRKLSASASADDAISSIDLQLTKLSETIADRLRQYETFSRYSKIGLLGGLIGFIISQSIYGAEAEFTRKELANLKAQKADLARKLETTNAVMSAMTLLESELEDMLLRLEDTAASTAHLESLWLVMISYIEQSVAQLQKTNSATFLTLFITRLTVMIDSWAQVKIHSTDLLNAFDDEL